LSGFKILLVEDNAVNREVAGGMLHDAGITVLHASDGAEAVRMVSSEAFDLVLMDIQMPVMDGLEATRTIRSDARFAGLPIIAMTAYAMSGDRERCLAAGMNDHIAKPFEPEMLYNVLGTWLHATRIDPGEKAEVSRSENEQDMPIPGGLPGIDIEIARRRFAGRGRLFNVIIREFCSVYAGAPARIQEIFREGDMDVLRKYAHSMRGAAGTIAAVKLMNAAASVEDVIVESGKAGKTMVEEFIAAVEEVLSCGLTSVAEEAPAGWQEGHVDETEMNELAAALEELKKPLNARSFSAVDEFRAVKERFGKATGRRLYAMESLINRFDYTAATKEIDAFLKTIKPGGGPQ
jgi:CheY-like chemotaxis protein/HPt (histidine-containing phosphotransfer) domain-containing protein